MAESSDSQRAKQKIIDALDDTTSKMPYEHAMDRGLHDYYIKKFKKHSWSAEKPGLEIQNLSICQTHKPDIIKEQTATNRLLWLLFVRFKRDNVLSYWALGLFLVIICCSHSSLTKWPLEWHHIIVNI